MDNDGPVHSASALGFTLGTQTPLFFEHDRADGPIVNGQRTRGSWYRLPNNPVTEKYNHGMLYQNDVGQWFRQRLLRVDVGPVPQRIGDSAWP
jgi:membrane-bound lytic murein transglycosylase B